MTTPDDQSDIETLFRVVARNAESRIPEREIHSDEVLPVLRAAVKGWAVARALAEATSPPTDSGGP